MVRPDCKKCPSPYPNLRYNPIFPKACPLGPANSNKLLGYVCPAELGVEEIRKRCANFDTPEVIENANPSTVPCRADKMLWQAWRWKKGTTCRVEELKDVRFCYGYCPRIVENT